jgi:hypothetical protein
MASNPTSFRPGDERARVLGRIGGAARQRVAKAALPEEAPPAPTDMKSALEFLSWVSHATLTGKIDPKTAREAAYSARAYVDGRKAVERSEERVAALERQIERMAKGKR